MTSTKRVQFSTEIAAPPARVVEVMTDPDTYRQWTAPFAEGSHFEGSWAQGERIRFLAPSGDGMVAEIAEHRPNEFISIRHLGMISDGVEDTESEEVRAWAPAYENYTSLRRRKERRSSSTRTSPVIGRPTWPRPGPRRWPSSRSFARATVRAELCFGRTLLGMGSVPELG
jgi:hypothetical protein